MVEPCQCDVKKIVVLMYSSSLFNNLLVIQSIVAVF